MKIGGEVIRTGPQFLKYTYGRCLLILLRKNEPALQTIARSSDPASIQQFKEFIVAIRSILSMKMSGSQISLMLHYIAMLNVISSTLRHCESSVVDEITMNDMEETMYQCLNIATESLVTAPYTNHRKVTVSWLKLIIMLIASSIDEFRQCS